ncbi:hypothetical protein T190115A13A_220012 [Tenacibaculum sp. 190524A02b]|uniref:Uncharacterized protein n=1 Tax=Tenacibaculum vairaonense TaxID=3137860 RepID=A0ABM9PL90_9FLAO
MNVLIIKKRHKKSISKVGYIKIGPPSFNKFENNNFIILSF